MTLSLSLDYEAVAYADSTPDLIYIGIERGAEDGVAVIQVCYKGDVNVFKGVICEHAFQFIIIGNKQRFDTVKRYTFDGFIRASRVSRS